MMAKPNWQENINLDLTLIMKQINMIKKIMLRMNLLMNQS